MSAALATETVPIIAAAAIMDLKSIGASLAELRVADFMPRTGGSREIHTPPWAGLYDAAANVL